MNAKAIVPETVDWKKTHSEGLNSSGGKGLEEEESLDNQEEEYESHIEEDEDCVNPSQLSSPLSLKAALNEDSIIIADFNSINLETLPPILRERVELWRQIIQEERLQQENLSQEEDFLQEEDLLQDENLSEEGNLSHEDLLYKDLPQEDIEHEEDFRQQDLRRQTMQA